MHLYFQAIMKFIIMKIFIMKILNKYCSNFHYYGDYCEDNFLAYDAMFVPLI